MDRKPTRTTRAPLGLALAAALAAGVVYFAAPPGVQAATPVEHISLAEITRGMTGYGLTVFEGTRIDTFTVTVVGVQRGVRADGSLILVEVAGHDLARSSIAQGMSGSPVYLDGRLAGALALGWGGALRPLAGVTPVEEMLTLPAGQGILPPGGKGLDAGLWGDSGALAASLASVRPAADLAAAVLGPGTAVPVARDPGSLAGWPSPEELALELMAGLVPAGAPSAGLRPENWFITPLGLGGGALAGESTGSPAGDGAPALAGGSACAVPLVMGDAQLGAIGTVTWVQGDEVYMMGHPFLQRGPVNLPLATAEILTVFPSRQLSFKLGSVGRVVGTVHHDQRSGLSGRLGPAPRLVPVELELSLPGGDGAPGTGKTYRFQVVDDPQLTPMLVFWTFYNSLLAEGDDASRQNVAYSLTLELEDGTGRTMEPLTLTGLAAGPGGAGGLATEVMAPLNLLLDNPYGTVRLRKVVGTLAVSRPALTTTITGLTVPRTGAAAGGQLSCWVELTSWQEVPLRQRLTLDLPVDLEPGPYRLAVASAAEIFALEAQRAPGIFPPASLDGLLEVLRSERSPGTLVAVLFAPGSGVVLQGREMNHLPGRVAKVIRGGNLDATPTLADFVARAEARTDGVLQGHAVRNITVTPAAPPAVQERRP